MLLLALILLIIGIVLLVAAPFPNSYAVAWVLIIVGLILLVLGLASGVDLNLGDGRRGD